MSEEEQDLEKLKDNFIKDYINPYLDRLLDLRNDIQDANSFDLVRGIMRREHDFLQKEE